MRGYEKLSSILCSPEDIYQAWKVYVVRALQRIIQNSDWQLRFWDAYIKSKEHGYSRRNYLGTRNVLQARINLSEALLNNC